MRWTAAAMLVFALSIFGCGADPADDPGQDGCTGPACEEETYDLCNGVVCGGNAVCNPEDGSCVCPPEGCSLSPCAGVSCEGGTTCDPADGLCKCGGVACGANELCDASRSCVPCPEDGCPWHSNAVLGREVCRQGYNGSNCN